MGQGAYHMTDTLNQDGCWSVHQRPRAVRVGDLTVIGWTDSGGSIGVTGVNHESKTLTKTVLDRRYELDDHSSPAILRRDDGHLIVFWTEHNVGSEIRYAVSSAEASVESFDDVQTVSAGGVSTYPQPIQLANGDIYLFYRGDGGNDQWRYQTSTDGGATWSDDTAITSIETQFYVHPISDGSNIYFAAGDHRISSPNIYSWYFDTANDTVHDLSGTQIATVSELPITSTANLTTLADLANPCKQYDLQLDGSNNPVVAFTEHVSTGSGGGDGDYRARWAKWDGSAAVVGSEIVGMGGALPESHYYEGGLSLDAQDPTTVYVSVEQSDRHYQIQQWTTNDSGSTWTKVQNLSPSGSGFGIPSTKRGRPISPRGHDESELQVTWWAGWYDTYTDYSTRVIDSFAVSPPSAPRYSRQNGEWDRPTSEQS